MKIKIFDKEGKEVFSGKYLYLEGGFEKDNTPSFHINVCKEHFGDYEIHFHCKDMSEIEEFIKDLKRQFKEEKWEAH